MLIKLQTAYDPYQKLVEPNGSLFIEFSGLWIRPSMSLFDVKKRMELSLIYIQLHSVGIVYKFKATSLYKFLT